MLSHPGGCRLDCTWVPRSSTYAHVVEPSVIFNLCRPFSPQQVSTRKLDAPSAAHRQETPASTTT
eukprot:scaffold20196_cov69-Phaeocystis_antarctica.AAC.6